jgi:NifU-like protein involved in Fe-S cluster formation
VRACALGQAASALVGERVIGQSPDQLEAARDALRGFLKGAPAEFPPGWEALDLFEPAVPHKSRHGSILLAIDAAAEAARKANG